jgi:heptosyltransferase-2
MARTWPVTRPKRIALKVFDAVAGPLSWPFLNRRTRFKQTVDRILVVELWHMGDVVIATSALQSLRKMYPDASITLLAKEHARELLAGSKLVDDIVTFDFPWTATGKKYSPSRYDRAAISEIVKQLRSRRFDISIDCRMDLRSNILTRAINARRRIGYDFGGGSFLLTDTVAAPPASQHKVDDWRGLLSVLDAWSPRRMPRGVEPQLRVGEAERREAEATLRATGIDPDRVIVGIHPGGSHEAKRWATDNFAQVGREICRRHEAQVVIFVDPDGTGSDMQIKDAAMVRTSIREMMALFTHCDVLLCNDSGPMHIAAAVGTPVVAVFRTGDPNAYGPRGIGHTVVGKGAPWGRTTDVAVDDVLDATDAAVAAAVAAIE